MLNFAETVLAKKCLFLFKEYQGFGDFGTEYDLWVKYMMFTCKRNKAKKFSVYNHPLDLNKLV